MTDRGRFRSERWSVESPRHRFRFGMIPLLTMITVTAAAFALLRAESLATIGNALAATSLGGLALLGLARWFGPRSIPRWQRLLWRGGTAVMIVLAITTQNEVRTSSSGAAWLLAPIVVGASALGAIARYLPRRFGGGPPTLATPAPVMLDARLSRRPALGDENGVSRDDSFRSVDSERDRNAR